MNNSGEALALRRRALVARAAVQRMEMQEEIAVLMAPVNQAGAMLNRVNWKMALGVGSAAVGVMAFRPAKSLSLISAGMSAYKLVRGFLANRGQ